ncbi:pentapeptide repeat-containing protein [Streptomyces sp. NPDC096046]|uniref:pentapeptide repeat-containing protein n=1 Tax=Streptomyces sp. NPDC096046 TaxID=3155542 RepID=UPI0033296552
MDHRGTSLDTPLIQRLLWALRDPATGNARFGFADFGAATFGNGAYFESATFEGAARFGSATFESDAYFGSATFQFSVDFGSATFQGSADFGSATFRRSAYFESTTFNSGARFGSASFERDAYFGSATFERDADFGAATFERDADFGLATLQRTASLGPLACAGRVELSGTVFGAAVTIALAARHLECHRTRWSATAALHLRYATVDFTHAVVAHPLSIVAEPNGFVIPSVGQVDERVLASAAGDPVRIVSLRGVDAAHLVLTDIDLTDCRFTGAFHLDKLRIEGKCTFAVPPEQGRWTRRRVLAEEHHWRALTPGNPATPRGWTPGPHHPDPALTPGPDELASVYRALRKATEDAKNEPDAADFYYGEMEMRRHDRARPRAERALLTVYWALSGYGLRASRALIGLLVAMTMTVVLLMLVGLPSQPRVQSTTGTLTDSGSVALSTRASVPGGETPRPWADRFSWSRAERAARTAVNSVIFRSAGQGLTVPGTYVEMTSRLVEPALLALALLAIRGRVKR